MFNLPNKIYANCQLLIISGFTNKISGFENILSVGEQEYIGD